MRGPFLLKPLQVDLSVPASVGGVYCLGNDRDHVMVVGRAETHLSQALKDFWKEFQFFWYEPALSPRECYTIQCRQYHRLLDKGELADKTHPKPDNTDFKCPVCGA